MLQLRQVFRYRPLVSTNQRPAKGLDRPERKANTSVVQRVLLQDRAK
jgi:hypothetical protein